MTSDEALERIHAAWLDWAAHRIDDAELAARIAEVLEATGRAVIRSVDEVANDSD